MSLLPTLTRLQGTAEQQRLYDTASAQVFAVALPLALGGCILAPAIINLVFGGAYSTSGAALRLLIWAIPVSVVRDIAIIGLMSAGREGRILRITAAAATLNVVLNLLLIPRYSMLGAAAATVITETLRMLAAFAYARSYGFAIPGLVRFWKAALSGLGMAALLLAFRLDGLLTGVPLGAAAYALVLTLTGGLRVRREGVALRV
jgi:O-antigen/teichoic acid export membrane protein